MIKDLINSLAKADTNKEIEKLLITADKKNEEALEAVIMLAKIYNYGLYGETKDLEKAKLLISKAKELEQMLSKEISLSYNISQEIRELDQILSKEDNSEQISSEDFYSKPNISEVKTKENIKAEQKHLNRFDNIQNNLSFVDKKDSDDDKQSMKSSNKRFDNIQNNLKFVGTEDDK